MLIEYRIGAASAIVALLVGCQAPPAPTSNATAGGSGVRTVTIPGTTQTFDLVWIEDGGFWAGRCEVTWNEYLAFCSWGDLPDGVDAESRPSQPLPSRPFDRGFGLDDHPVIGVSWPGARSYCEWLGAVLDEPIRLPRADEWAILAAAALPLVESGDVWHAGNSGETTHPVGSMPADAHGLHDVFGNLWEYLDEPYSDDEDDRAVSRGGSYLTSAEALGVDAQLPFNWDWLLDDSTFPPGRWWVPDGHELGFRIVSLAPGP